MHLFLTTKILCILTVICIMIDVPCCCALHLCVLKECTASIFVEQVVIGNGRGMLLYSKSSLISINGGERSSRFTNNPD